jgi:hypothetical protein
MINYNLLPKSWGKIEHFEEDFELFHLKLKLNGFSATDISTGAIVLGSSANTVNEPERAFYELLERAWTVESLKDSKLKELFPVSTSPSFVFSKSNGIALHTNLEMARASARFEVLERDAVLRSWFGEIKPELISLDDLAILTDQLAFGYDVKAFIFSNDEAIISYDSEVRTIGVFAFPKKDNYPLIFGLGCRQTVKEAFRHAQSELYQRLAFVYSEDWQHNLEINLQNPTPESHLNFYLRKESHLSLKKWLSGNRYIKSKRKSLNSKIIYADLRPTGMASDLFLVKVQQNDLLPLCFGDGYLDYVESWPNLEDRIHPIA